MPTEKPCEIRCHVCGQWADSRLQFDTAGSFFTSSLIGKTVVCTWCGEETPCSVEDLRFYELKEGENIGSFVEGRATVQNRRKR